MLRVVDRAVYDTLHAYVTVGGILLNGFAMRQINAATDDMYEV